MNRFITDRRQLSKIHRLVGELDWRWVGRSGCDRSFPVEKFSDGPDDPVTCKECGEDE